LVIVRVGIQTEVKINNAVHFQTDNFDKFWNYILVNQPSWKIDGVTILYMTQRYAKNDISLFIKAKDQDTLAKYLLERLAKIQSIGGFWIINLFEPRFFLSTNNSSESLTRFTLNITTDPSQNENIYQQISHMLPNKDFMISYIAYTFHKFKSDIIVSILCTGSSTLNGIVDKYIRNLDGIFDIEITRISRTLKLVTSEELREVGGVVFEPSEGLIIEELSSHEEDMMSGC
jgi:hypothetical protein